LLEATRLGADKSDQEFLSRAWLETAEKFGNKNVYFDVLFFMEGQVERKKAKAIIQLKFLLNHATQLILFYDVIC
jgi:hypothetical protein